jgi:putative nucleotidyltransferase with HDIG domain
MEPLSFKNIKLFPGAKFPHKKKNGGAAPADGTPQPWGRRLLRLPGLYLAVFVLGLGGLISYLPSKSLPAPKVGDIVSSDIVAPADLTVEDLETTAKRRKEAEENVIPVWALDVNVALNTEANLREFFAKGRSWIASLKPAQRRVADVAVWASEDYGIEVDPADLEGLVRRGFASALEDGLISLLRTVFDQGVILNKNLFSHGEPEIGLALLRGQQERVLRTSDVLDLREAQDRIAAEAARVSLSASDQKLLVALAHSLLTPNITFHRVETEARKQAARNLVETVFYTIKKGKIIARKGDEATAETVKQIVLVNRSLRTKPSWLVGFLGSLFLLALLFISLWYYLRSELRSGQALETLRMMGLTLVIGVLTAKLGAYLGGASPPLQGAETAGGLPPLYFGLPYAMGSLLFAFIYTGPIALTFTILNSLVFGYLFGGQYYLMIYSFLGGLAALYGVKRYQRRTRTALLRAGLFILMPVNAFVVLTFHLVRDTPNGPAVLGAEVGMALLSGALSAGLAFVLLPIYETVFGLTTQTKLLELTNSDLPVFRQMAMEAPGSYHHSLVVSTLAEKAAEEIHLDPMLVKAGALYHDIGKIKMPDYYIENTTRDPDLHRELSPNISTLVIISHVKEGVDLARKLRLPAALREIIEQHHGTSLVRYFYQKAIETYDPEMQKVGEEDYRYPGPKPRSKEAGLVLLADSVEAASRSLKSPSRDSLTKVITEIFSSYLEDGQLDECDFSIRELRAVASSFLSILYAIYHPRVHYPGFEFEPKKDKKPVKAAAHDRSH